MAVVPRSLEAGTEMLNAPADSVNVVVVVSACAGMAVTATASAAFTLRAVVSASIVGIEKY